jgi:hypothetical protein
MEEGGGALFLDRRNFTFRRFALKISLFCAHAVLLRNQLLSPRTRPRASPCVDGSQNNDETVRCYSVPSILSLACCLKVLNPKTFVQRFTPVLTPTWLSPGR